MHSLLTTGSRWYFLKAQYAIDSDKGDSKAPSHAVRNHLFASCGVQAVRSSTCTAEHASDKTIATVQIESSLLSGSFFQTPARLRCVFFSSVLIFVGEEKEEV